MTTATVPQTREEWLEQRRTGIGGSDAAAICGQDDFGRTAATVYDDKLGLVPDTPPTPAMERGRHLEAVAANLYSEKTGRKIRRQPMRRHREHTFMIGNIDRQIVSDEKGVGLLELKCPGLRNFAKMKAHGLPKGYILQGAHYLEVFGYDWMSFGLFNAENWSLIHFDIERDRELGQFLVEHEGAFWRAVENRERPSEVAPDLPDLPEVSGEVVVRTDPEWLVAVAALAEARNLTKTAGELEAVAKGAVKSLMGGFGIQEGGGYRFYHQEREGRAQHAQTVKAIEKAGPLDPMKAVKAVVRGLRDVLTYEFADADLAVQVGDWLLGSSMDLDALKKIGKPFAHFQGYPLKVEAETE
ncbi:hypothetical protein LCGC14_1413010 [marine sediment metagenome]|uniref:YqaJ viral recombinase domain-containing protein n=1 Tax=marine sediment metagenome TaxID=412755 RepID=A0A0F9KER5_9ZZZZ